MPMIAWFYGIATRMYFLDHPPPHFQAVYGEHEANVSIATGEVIEGRLPPTASFKRVFLEHGAPTWPNGFDVAPAWLHRELESAGALSRATVAG
jgi:hypothetical protein